MKTLQHAIEILGLAGIGNLYEPPISPQAVQKWKVVPFDRCLAIERATEGVVTRRGLRKDDWWLMWPELVTEEFPAPPPAFPAIQTQESTPEQPAPAPSAPTQTQEAA